MDKAITARVAAVIDDSTLVLNAGSAQGVREGMLFVVFGEHDEITDPETGASLGKWESVKARVVVTHVQDRMCTVRSPQAQEEQVSDGTRPLSTMMVEHSLGRYGDQTDQWQRLDVRARDLRGSPRAQPIRVGDGARSIPQPPHTSPPAVPGETDSSAGSPAPDAEDAPGQ